MSFLPSDPQMGEFGSTVFCVLMTTIGIVGIIALIWSCL